VLRALVSCPGCGVLLESAWKDVGRDGQCPDCREVFPIVPCVGAGGWGKEGAAGAADEPGEPRALWGPAVLGACFVLVMLSGIRGWVDPRSSAAALAGLYRLTIIAVSVACLAFVAFSAAARSSLAPAALAASAWGVAVAVVLAGLGRCLAGVAGSVYGSSPRLGLYGSLVAAVLLAVVAGCAGFRYRLVLPGMARRLAAFAVTALLGAAVCVGFHAAPRCRDLAARAATVAATFRTPAQPVVPTRLPAGPEPEAEAPAAEAAGHGSCEAGAPDS
jgi:hypothetical protein